MKGDQRRASIVNAAADIIMEQGLAAATVRAVASAIEAAPAQIHHHFPSASALKAEALQAATERVLPYNDQRFGQMKLLDQLVLALVGDRSEHDRRAIALWNDALVVARQDELVRAVVQKSMTECLAAVSAIISNGQKTGAFSSPANAAETAMRLMTLVVGADQMNALIRTRAGIDVDALVRSEVSALLRPT